MSGKEETMSLESQKTFLKRRVQIRIKSGYVGAEEFRARTTSRNHALRLVYFYYAMILYNASLLANLILAKKFNLLDRMKEPIIPVRFLKRVFQKLIIESFLMGRSSRITNEHILVYAVLTPARV